MARRHTSTSMAQPLKITGAIIVVLLALIFAGYLFGPDKEAAPRLSVISFEQPPEANDEMEIDASAADPVEAETQAGSDRGGMVWGYVRSADGDPLDATIAIVRTDSIVRQLIRSFSDQEIPVQTTQSKASRGGYFELNDISFNEAWRVAVYTPDRAPQLSDPFMLDSQHDSVHVDINMYPGTTISGRVIDPDGNPIADAQLVCAPGIGALLAPLSDTPTVAYATSDADGSFELTNLTKGSFRVYAMAEGYELVFRGRPVYPDGIGDIENFDIVLEPVEVGGHAVFGRVADAQESSVEGAKVTLFGLTMGRKPHPREALSDANGEFRIDGISAGRYVLRVQHETLVPNTTLNVRLDESIDIVLQDYAAIRGTVVFEGYDEMPKHFRIVATPPLANLADILTLYTNVREPRMETFDAPDGVFEMTVPPGRYEIRAMAGDGASAPLAVELAPGETMGDLRLVISGEIPFPEVLDALPDGLGALR